MPSPFSSETRRAFRTPAYIVCAVAIVVTVVEYIVTILPLTPRAQLWRFGSEGMLANVSAVPILMLMLALIIALSLADARAIRVVRAAAAVACAFLGLVAIAFLMDIMKVKANVSADASYNFMFASLVALFKILLQSLAAGAIALAARNALADLGTGIATSATGRTAIAA